jgi:WD40 repeat protein
LTALDWIYDASFSPYDTQKGVLITAHNEIVPLTIDHSGDATALALSSTIISPSRPILFSAAVAWTAPARVLVAAGTAFGEIVVWECLFDIPSSQTNILSILTGHEGSIFGVSISPEVAVSTAGGSVATRLLATCSDDRTIRIWDISERAGSTDTDAVQSLDQLSKARETGFGSTLVEQDGLDAGTEASSRCIAMAMGHASRIWHVGFDTSLTSSSSRPISVYSFGEDATAQKWELRLDQAATLVNVAKIPCSNGKHIWSFAMLKQQDGDPLIATGGADGKISLLGGWATLDSGNDVTAINKHEGTECDDMDISVSFDQALSALAPETHQVAGRRTKKSEKDGFSRYAFVSENTFLAVTVFGRLILVTLSSPLSYTEIQVPEDTRSDLRSYHVIISPGPGVVLLGSKSGRVYLFSLRTQSIQEIAQLHGKVASIICPMSSVRSMISAHTMSSIAEESDGKVNVLATVLGSSQAVWLDIPVESETMTVTRSDIPLEKGLIPKSCGSCGDLLILGTRSGAVAVYRKTLEGFVYLTSRSDTRTKESVSCICPLPPLQGREPQSFLTTCRDGIYRIYEIRRQGDDISLHLRHQTSPPLGPMLEGAWFAETTDGQLDLIIYGFRGMSFVVWNETTRQEIVTIPCGGGHRCFDFVSLSHSVESLRFVYTKASNMNVYSQSRMHMQVIRHGCHGREIKAAAANDRYLATAAEDTLIRIWERPSNHTTGSPLDDMYCVAVLSKHAAGIQSLKWHEDELLFSSGGNEEFFVWRVSSLDSNYKGLAVVCEAVLPDRTADGDLRILGFDVSASRRRGDDLIISLAFSNSTLKTYRYISATGFELLAQGKYTGCCLTQIHHLWLPSAEMRVITASTDGYVAVWKDDQGQTATEPEAVSNYSLIHSSKLHQSSIKCFDIRQSDARGTCYWQLFTGGDDSALGILSLVYHQETDTFELLSRARVKEAHGAAITGIRIVNEGANTITIATVSNDQRIKVWRMESHSGRIGQVALLDNSYSAIADSGDLESADRGELWHVGVGMERWNWVER